jgi:hypothetical protein
MAASKAAEAGSKMSETEDWTKTDAENLAAEARRYNNAREVLLEARNPENKLILPILKPIPITAAD